MEPDDLSIGLEVWARPGLGLDTLLDDVAVLDPATAERHGDADWHAFRAMWRAVGGRSMLGPAKGYVVYRLARRALELPGSFIECGVYKGGTSFLLGLLLEASGSDKSIIMCDTWAGMPRPDRTVDRAYREGSLACSADDVREEASRLGLGKRCVIEPGLFAESFPRLSNEKSFAFAHLDCDLFRSTKEALEFVVPRLAEGAPLVLDDYYDESHGVMTAVNEMAERLGMLIHLAPWGQAFIVKGEAPSGAPRVAIGRHRVHLTTAMVREEPLFLPYLEAIARREEERAARLRRFIGFCKEAANASRPLRLEQPASQAAWASHAFRRARAPR